MIEAVIFDMDGVIMDSEPVYNAIEREMHKEIGLDLPDEILFQSMGKGSLSWWRELKERYDFPGDPAEYARREDEEYLDYLFSDETEKVMMPGFDVLLKELKAKGYKIAIASGATIKAIDRVVEIFGFEAYIDARVSGDEVDNGKPAPDVFLEAAARLGVQPAACVVVEDSVTGLMGALAGGMTAVAYMSAPAGLLDYSLADYRINDHAELLAILADLGE